MIFLVKNWYYSYTAILRLHPTNNNFDTLRETACSVFELKDSSWLLMNIHFTNREFPFFLEL